MQCADVSLRVVRLVGPSRLETTGRPQAVSVMGLTIGAHQAIAHMVGAVVKIDLELDKTGHPPGTATTLVTVAHLVGEGAGIDPTVDGTDHLHTVGTIQRTATHPTDLIPDRIERLRTVVALRVTTMIYLVALGTGITAALRLGSIDALYVSEKSVTAGVNRRKLLHT